MVSPWVMVTVTSLSVPSSRGNLHGLGPLPILSAVSLHTLIVPPVLVIKGTPLCRNACALTLGRFIVTLDASG